MIVKIFLLLSLLGSTLGYAENSISDQKIMKQVNEFFIESDDAQIFCRAVGKGKPLIVIHGGPGASQDYLLPQLYELAKNHFVIFYDQRGAGKSTGEINDETMAISMFLKDLESIRKTFNFDKISILGHSWGAIIAMHYAIEHPDHVEKLVLANPCPATSDEFSLFEKSRDQRLSKFQDEITRIQNTIEFQEGDPVLFEQMLRMYVQVYCHRPEDAERLNLSLSRSAVINAIKIQKTTISNTLSKPFDLREDLKKLQIPTLVIHGDDDPIPVSTAQNIHKSILGSKFIVLPECGHYPYVEQPKLFFDSLNKFLD